MNNCAEGARGPDDQQLLDVASILAAGILRLRDRQSLPVPISPDNNQGHARHSLRLRTGDSKRVEHRAAPDNEKADNSAGNALAARCHVLVDTAVMAGGSNNHAHVPGGMQVFSLLVIQE